MTIMKRFLIVYVIVFIFLASAPTTTTALTNNDLLTQIQSLLKIVERLQAQLAELNGTQQSTTPAPTAPGSSTNTDTNNTTNYSSQQTTTPTFCSSLSSTRFGIGLRSNNVIKLQQFLKTTGDFTYPEFTNYYGNQTKLAVQRYQCRTLNICSGLPHTNGYGLAGPGTRKQMCTIQTTSTNTFTSTTPQTPNNPTKTITTIYTNPTINTSSTSNNKSSSRGNSSSSTSSSSRGSSSSSDASTTNQATQLQSCTATDNSTIQSGQTETRTRYQTSSVPYGQQCQSEIQTRTCNNGSWDEWSGGYIGNGYQNILCTVDIQQTTSSQGNFSSEKSVTYWGSSKGGRLDRLSKATVDMMDKEPYTGYVTELVNGAFDLKVPKLSDFSNAIVLIKSIDKDIWPIVFWQRFYGSPDDKPCLMRHANVDKYPLKYPSNKIKGIDLYNEHNALTDFKDTLKIALQVSKQSNSKGVFFDIESYSCYDNNFVTDLAKRHGKTSAEIVVRLKEIGHEFADLTHNTYPDAILYFYNTSLGWVRDDIQRPGYDLRGGGYNMATGYIVEGILDRIKSQGYNLKVIDGWVGEYTYFSMDKVKSKINTDLAIKLPYLDKYSGILDVAVTVAPFEDYDKIPDTHWTKKYLSKDNPGAGRPLIDDIYDFAQVYAYILNNFNHMWIYGTPGNGIPIGYDIYSPQVSPKFGTVLNSVMRNFDFGDTETIEQSQPCNLNGIITTCPIDESPASVTTDKSSYIINNIITVMFDGALGTSDEWIGLFEENETNYGSKSISWKATNNTKTGVAGFKTGIVTFNSSSLVPGRYKIVLTKYTHPVQRISSPVFEVKPATINTTINATASTYKQGDTISVSFSGAAGKAGEWVGVYESNETDYATKYKLWKYTDNTKDKINKQGKFAGTITFDSSTLAPGVYKVTLTKYVNPVQRISSDNTFTIIANTTLNTDN